MYCFLIFLSLFQFSCSQEKIHGEDVIEREKFVSILSDVQIFESSQHFIRNKNKDFNIDYSYQWIFKKYDITEVEFKTSLEYYTSDPKTYEEIYDDVIIRLSEKQAETRNEEY